MSFSAWHVDSTQALVTAARQKCLISFLTQPSPFLCKGTTQMPLMLDCSLGMKPEKERGGKEELEEGSCI
jgi:hypothetical protein